MPLRRHLIFRGTLRHGRIADSRRRITTVACIGAVVEMALLATLLDGWIVRGANDDDRSPAAVCRSSRSTDPGQGQGRSDRQRATLPQRGTVDAFSAPGNRQAPTPQTDGVRCSV
jgi:hypothetical protein